MDGMKESLKQFSDCLVMVDRTLKEYTENAKQMGSNIFGTIESFANDFVIADSRGEENTLQQGIRNIFQDFRTALNDWQKEMDQSLGLRKQIEEYGNGLIIVVFGRTNAGKSTLGNFLRGKKLKDAAFDNPWKHDLKIGPIKVVEKADSSVIKEIDTEWFAEGATETTREIQLFQMPGFLWIDTPGFGSTNDQTLGKLARDYVKAADLIIYLEHSDNPGLESITNNVVEVMRGGRKNTLIAINHSDVTEKVKGPNGKYLRNENGEILRKSVAKDRERRQLQENYLKELLQKKLNENKVDALSISMLLANSAIEQNEEKLYADSNIDSLFKRIKDLIPDNETILKRKYGKTIQDCILKIDEALGNNPNPDGLSLDRLEKRLADLKENIKKYDREFNSEEATMLIINPLLDEARKEIDKILNEAEKILESGGDAAKNLDANMGIFQDKLHELTIRKVEEKIRELLSAIWEREALNMAREFPAMAKAQLKRRQETHTYTVTETFRESRSPDGFWETVKGWFGAKYTTVKEKKVQKEQIIDLGFNTQEERSRIMTEIEKTLHSYVKSQLDEAREECLARGGNHLDRARASLRQARVKLENQKKNLKKEFAELGV